MEEEGMEKHPQINPDDLLAMARGARIAELLPFAQEEIERAERQIYAAIFRQIEAGTLEPQAARDAWGQVYAGRQLLKRLDKAVASGQSAGNDLQTQLEDQDDG